MNFQKSIVTCMKKYADFKGRASRSELWWYMLFTFLVSLTLSVINPSLSVIMLGFLLPSLAVGVRRLRDAGLHPGWIALWPVTLIDPSWVGLPDSYKAIGGFAVILLVILWVQKSKPNDAAEVPQEAKVEQASTTTQG